MNSVFLDELSWTEIAQGLEQGMDTVLICAASHEQHGPHLPLSTDAIIGRAVCEQVARRLGNTLVAPLVVPGLSTHHMNHPGSLTLRTEIFCGLIEDYVSAYVKHGFRKIILYSSHGGNCATLDSLSHRLASRYPDVRIFNTVLLKDYIDVCAQADHLYNLEDGVCGGHACCMETSIVLHLQPKLVHMDRAVPGYVSADRDGVGHQLLTHGMMQVSPCGILGDPTPASGEQGEVFLQLLSDKLYQIILEKL